MSKFFTLAFISAFIVLNLSSVQASPKSGCTTISKVQYAQFQKLPQGSSKAALDRAIGSSSCKLSGYSQGLTAYGYRLTYDSKNWLVIVFKDNRQYKAGIVPVGMGLREG